MTSCCPQQAPGQSTGVTDQIGASLSEVKSLEISERTVALNICYSFRAKRSVFRGPFLGQGFRFDFTHEYCDENREKVSSKISTTLAQTLQSQPLVFDSIERDAYERNVQTTFGDLVEVCDQLFDGKEVS